jgi:hypothetical protein
MVASSPQVFVVLPAARSHKLPRDSGDDERQFPRAVFGLQGDDVFASSLNRNLDTGLPMDAEILIRNVRAQHP